jgi:transposase-like protein
MENNPICPKCQTPMCKGGKPLSGTRRVQRYKCSKCGATTTNPLSTNNNHTKYVRINMDELRHAQLILRALKAKQPIEDYIMAQLFREH